MKGNNEIAGTHLKVLILEDSPHDFELIQEQLIDAGYILDLTHVENEGGFTSALREDWYNIILSDFKLPGFDAFGALHIRNKICPEVPFICVSGSIGEETAIELLKMGAVDYVLKDRPERLPFAVRRAIREHKENQELKHAEEELKKSEQRLRDILFSTADWVWEVDKDGKYTYSSQKGHELFEAPLEDILGKTPFDFMPKDEAIRVGPIFAQIVAQKAPIKDLENWNIGKDGQMICLLTNGLPILDDTGELIGYRGIDKNITDRKLAEQELINAKEKAEASDKLKTAFINNISHEIRTPLNAILGFGQFLAESELPKDQRMEYFSIVQKSSNRLINTVSDYMDMARIVSGTMEVYKNEFLLQPLFNETIQNTALLCAEKMIDFEAVIPQESDNLTVFSDSEFIRKILNILLDNALKFTKEGRIRCGYSIESGFLEFFVQDSGIGIAQDKLGIIFNMFMQEDASTTRGYEGSGLGLTIAQGLVKLIGGTIEATSEKSKGSAFKFAIPHKKPTLTGNQSITETKKSTDTKKQLVLIAEDEELNFVYMEVIMKTIGCNYLRALNGAEAVEICKQNNSISLVLMDIKMPVMNGIEATQLIHKFRPELPIIATTAYAQTGDEHRFLAAGCDGYLPKPARKADLLALLQKYN